MELDKPGALLLSAFRKLGREEKEDIIGFLEYLLKLQQNNESCKDHLKEWRKTSPYWKKQGGISMNKLVFLDSNKIDAIPFTTSDVIAECAGVKHHAVQQMISRHEVSLKSFGLVAFEMRAVKKSRGVKYEKLYRLNEPQATLLITFLKNTESVVRFKTELVRQFYLMRAELQKRQIAKTDRKPIRRELTDTIQNDPDHGKWDFKLYTDLAYKMVTGKNAAQIRQERGAEKKAVASDYMTSDELVAITKLEYQMAALKDLGMNYQQIKMLLLNRQVIGNIA